MNIAIIGAGVSGLAAAWFLLQKSCRVTLFDPKPIGSGTSGMAAGLMHPYAGAHAKLNWQGHEGWSAAYRLLRIAEGELGEPVAQHSGLLRVGVTEEQLKDFAHCARTYPEVKWISAAECALKAPQIIPREGIWIPSGILVNSSTYLQGLWRACQKLGAIFVPSEIANLEELQDFDIIVIAMGTASARFFESSVHLTAVKGQIVEFEWPAGIPQLPFPVNSQVYMVMDSKKNTCLVGATYEREFTHMEADLDAAMSDLAPKLRELMPSLLNSRIVSCRAGVRASMQGHLPVVKRLDSRCWLLAGMGSKGLLYHALYAEKLVDLIFS